MACNKKIMDSNCNCCPNVINCLIVKTYWNTEEIKEEIQNIQPCDLTTIEEQLNKLTRKVNRLLKKCCKIVAWEQNVYYEIGAEVLDNGKIMECIKANQSNYIHITDQNYWKVKEILVIEEESTVKTSEMNMIVSNSNFNIPNEELVTYEEKKGLFGSKIVKKK